MNINANYEICVVGGGISGLYCAYELSKTHKVVLLDDRSYAGGRIHTHKEGYEVGAARFNNKHKILLSLIRKFKLTPVKLPTTIDYIHENTQTRKIQKYADIQDHFGKTLDYIISKTKPTNELREITFYQNIINILKDKNLADEIVNMFGYYSEIIEMNAYDAYMTFKNDFGNIQYYVLKEGLSQLCNILVSKIKENGSKVILRNRVNDIKKVKKDILEVITSTHIFHTNKVIISVKPHQLLNFNIIKNVHKYVKSVYQAPLIRIYAKYDNPIWFKDVNRTTTNNILRQVIPIDKKSGLIMVSYTDGKDTHSFMKNKYELKSLREIRKIIKENLQLIFPDKYIPDPSYIKAHLWEVGCHHFRPKYNSDEIREHIWNPTDNVFICGEGFSKKQAWMEGSLETASFIIKNIRYP
tara:strand:- start:18197 stop:19432 length:1236 start_codon:yes stop_codon:yes gene_type:complete